jgi:hypothetical protein
MSLQNIWVKLSLSIILAGCYASAAESSTPASWATNPSALAKLEGQPVDIDPWVYAWRGDREAQEKPEAYFIPRRLERIDKVYRTAYRDLPEKELKSLYYKLPDLMQPLPPAPKGRLISALLWTGKVPHYLIEIRWPDNLQTEAIPAPEKVEVRTYPTSFGWFGWTVDKVLANPQISEDRRTWTFACDPDAMMDDAYDARVDSAIEMVAVFCEDGKKQSDPSSVLPGIRVLSPSLGKWKRMDVEIECDFRTPAENIDANTRLECFVAMSGPAKSLANGRKGIALPVLYAEGARPGLDSRITIWTKDSGFTFRPSDLEKGPIMIPERGVFIAKASEGTNAKKFAAELAAKNLKGIRQMTRERAEAASWEEVMKEVRLWTCPEGTELKPFPEVPDPPMQVELPDPGWTNAWRSAVNQLRGPHMWGGLAFEVGRVVHEMDMIGLYEKSEPVYEHFLKSPGVKPDGDFPDGTGALEWASAMKHDMGYSHDGTHSSTGRLLFAMTERYFLTGDKEWFKQRRERLQTAADWIIRQRTTYLKDIPNRKELFAAGLMPPFMLGDYSLPTCDWHWYYVDNALSLQGLQRFADALADFDAEACRKYREEAEAYREDLRAVVDRETALAPVRLGRDGMYHSYIPRMAYAAGLPGPELGARQFPDADRFVGALALAEPFSALDANDPRMVDTLDVTDEMGTQGSDFLLYNTIEKTGFWIGSLQDKEAARKKKGLSADDMWFWNAYVPLPKASHNANLYLLQDDVPNFLRFWMNEYAVMVGSNGKLGEPWNYGNFNPCDAPDNGTAGWFMENFRDMLVMEDGQSLWIARATPRVWLEGGKKISVKNAPTYFGTLAYEIVSDMNDGKIAATVEMPSRNPPKDVLVRFRHPKSSPIKSVTVNGAEWKDFDPRKEVIRLHDVSGTVKVEAAY